MIHFGKIARKQNLTGVCLDSLSRIYTIPSARVIDCFQMIRQHVKCYLQMSAISGKNELKEVSIGFNIHGYHFYNLFFTFKYILS